MPPPRCSRVRFGRHLDGAHRAHEQDAVEGVGVARGRARDFVQRDQRSGAAVLRTDAGVVHGDEVVAHRGVAAGELDAVGQSGCCRCCRRWRSCPRGCCAPGSRCPSAVDSPGATPARARRCCCRSRITTVLPAVSCTSGRGNVGSEIASTPTVPPVPSVPPLVLPMLTVCVVASRRVVAAGDRGQRGGQRDHRNASR